MSHQKWTAGRLGFCHCGDGGALSKRLRQTWQNGWRFESGGGQRRSLQVYADDDKCRYGATEPEHQRTMEEEILIILQL